jgi:hypothetical protein
MTQAIIITMADGTHRTVEGEIYGDWAVTPYQYGQSSTGFYTVTHIPTGGTPYNPIAVSLRRARLVAKAYASLPRFEVINTPEFEAAKAAARAMEMPQ